MSIPFQTSVSCDIIEFQSPPTFQTTIFQTFTVHELREQVVGGIRLSLRQREAGRTLELWDF